MAFNEQSARKIIEFLLEDDCYEYKRWLKQIKKFNVEQIKNLLEGNNENLDIYQIKNKGIFDKLVQKFDNFSQITLKWYENEENYQYLKQLWKNYICIEDINEKIKNEQELADYLESNHVPYSKWPDKVKEEFKEAAEDTAGTHIHEEEIKKKLVQQHSKLRNCFEAIENLLNSLGNILTDAESEAKEKFKDLGKSSLNHMFSGLLGTLVCPFIKSVKTSANKKLLVKELKMTLEKYFRAECFDKNVVIDVVKDCEKTEGIGKFEVIGTKIYFSEDIGKTITRVFESKMVCGAVAIVSIINLLFSIREFKHISELTETITGKHYRDKLEKIKQRFKSHMTEIDIRDIDDPLLVQTIDLLKSKIESDKESLIQLLVEIKMDIKLLEQKKTESIIGACVSGALGVVSVVGTIVASGGMSLIYGLSTLNNIIAGGANILSAHDCINIIDELIKIQEEAKKESDEVEKQIKKLNLILSEKELHFPNFYNAFSEILEKEKIKCETFRF